MATSNQRLKDRRSVSDDDTPFDTLLADAAEYEKKALPDNTRRAYRNDWRDFRNWCIKRGRRFLPATPETVALYLSARARRLRPTTISRRLTVIGKVHKSADKLNPVTDARVRRVWRGILRDKGQAVNRKCPTLMSDLKQMLDGLPGGLSGIRDRALILIGFAGAMRRSEIVSLNLGDLQLTTEGFVVSIRRGKTDQTGRGRKIGIPHGQQEATCPVKAMLAWIRAAEVTRGPLFRKVNRHGRLEGTRLSDRSVALIVKRAMRAAGYRDGDFAGHSLRAGLATSAAMAGADERSIQNQTGHSSLKVLRTYIRDGSLFRNNAARKAGL